MMTPDNGRSFLPRPNDSDIAKKPRIDAAASRSIYFDNSATTALDPRARQAMAPFLDGEFGNPSSLHAIGRQARSAVDAARRQVAELLHAEPSEIVFTASGTEADNLAIRGVFDAVGSHGGHIVVSAMEHPAVMETCFALERQGVEVTRMPVGDDGITTPSALAAAMRPDTRLVSVMAANNIVGTLQPIAELGRIAHEHGSLFHTDAVQAVGKIPFDMKRQPIDLLSLSAHKFHGPKGVGALYIRQGVAIEPVIYGGGQERGLRSATENVAGIVGLGKAAELAGLDMADDAARLVQLRDRLVEGIHNAIPNAYFLGHRYCRLPGHVSVGFAGQEGEAIRLLLALDEAGIAISSGSACSSHHAGEPSHVLLAMGLDPFRARGSLRISLGRFNTADEVERFLAVLPDAVASLRSITTRTPLNV
jgi:cysteine desulfurase